MTKPLSPFVRIGGRAAISALVERFYDLMHDDPAYAELRAIHADDLAPMRESLTDFLCAWTGGPRDWFEKRPGACIMSAHGRFAGIDTLTGDQWIAAMGRAADETGFPDAEVKAMMLNAMARMCSTMAARAEAMREPPAVRDVEAAA